LITCIVVANIRTCRDVVAGDEHQWAIKVKHCNHWLQ
jgi:hypothetical protein